MNIFQAANGGATFLVVGAVGFGITGATKNIDISIFHYLKDSPSILLLMIFILLFKIKTAFDDHKHFGDAYQHKTFFRYIGFILAIFSWLLMAQAGWSIGQPIRSAEWLIYSILVSTLWIFVHLFEIWVDKGRPSTEAIVKHLRQKWVLINIVYISCLLVFLGYLAPVVNAESVLPLCVMMVFFAFDFFTSDSFDNLDE
ncbi:hypothetical protein [Sneathiella sp.]|uniref:hypothetical protein n=1 Tax=Sneathiella sp. TaxID=1964365 RepID=UPI0026104F1D|nr:hypothetical protein [Sneathiella sp.]MDF2365634.1 hypothetical protein [Sneathiella sp.]